jgi:CO dehydrogenase/acetyl-CoA synthase beta subunit
VEENRNRQNGMYAQKLKAGKRRTYFFDVRATKYDDYYITITESKRKFNDGGYERHKIFLYKEDFNKFVDALQNTVDHIKEELMPEYDFDQYNKPAEVIAGDPHPEVESVNSEEEDQEDTFEEEDEPVEESVSEEANKTAPGAADEDAMTWD